MYNWLRKEKKKRFSEIQKRRTPTGRKRRRALNLAEKERRKPGGNETNVDGVQKRGERGGVKDSERKLVSTRTEKNG